MYFCSSTYLRILPFTQSELTIFNLHFCFRLFLDGVSPEQVETVASRNFWQHPMSNGQDPTQILLEVLKREEFQKLLSSDVAKSSVWDRIAKEMARIGAPVPKMRDFSPGMRCHQKWRNLAHNYLKFVQRLKLTGTKKKSMKYFRDINDVMFVKQRFNPAVYLNTVDPSSLSKLTLEPCVVSAETSSTEPLFKQDKLHFSRTRLTPGVIISFLKQESAKLDNFSKKLLTILEVQNRQREDLLAFVRMCLGGKEERSKRQGEGKEHVMSIYV